MCLVIALVANKTETWGIWWCSVVSTRLKNNCFNVCYLTFSVKLQIIHFFYILRWFTNYDERWFLPVLFIYVIFSKGMERHFPDVAVKVFATFGNCPRCFLKAVGNLRRIRIPCYGGFLKTNEIGPSISEWLVKLVRPWSSGIGTLKDTKKYRKVF